jgi:hypothetical protein
MCGNPTVPMGPRTTFVGDFSTGNFSQWSGVQVQGYNGSGTNFGGNSRAQIVPGCDGKPAVRFTVQPGDQVAAGERAEVAMQRGGGLTHEGDERWYDFSVKFDNDFRWPTGAYFIIMQWHSSSGSPPLSIEVSNSGNLMVHNNRLQARKTVAPIIKGQWMNLVFHTKFSNNSSVGFVHMYVNGQERLARTGFRTMADGENYLKMGIYRNGTVRDPTASVYNQGLRILAP